jgi:hypothetical protein
MIATLWFTSKAMAELGLRLTVIAGSGVELPPHPWRASIPTREIISKRKVFMTPPKDCIRNARDSARPQIEIEGRKDLGERVLHLTAIVG